MARMFCPTCEQWRHVEDGPRPAEDACWYCGNLSGAEPTLATRWARLTHIIEEAWTDWRRLRNAKKGKTWR